MGIGTKVEQSEPVLYELYWRPFKTAWAQWYQRLIHDLQTKQHRGLICLAGK